MITLQPCDILLYVNNKKGPIQDFSRWAIGEVDHVAMYIGKMWVARQVGARIEVPIIYESDLRGVQISSIYHHTGRLVKVMRPRADVVDQCSVDLIVNTAISIASEPDSYYDYVSIVRFCVPYILKRKFPWLPISPPSYERDRYMICSEAVAEVFWRNQIKILPQDVVPLPVDFETSLILWAVGGGILLENVMP